MACCNSSYRSTPTNSGCGIKSLLEKIERLQKEAVREELKEEMCDANRLGNSDACGLLKYNTRPIEIFCGCDHPWNCPIDRNSTDGTMTNVFRVEKVEGDYAVFRALEVDNDDLKSTNSFITIKLCNIDALRCLGDCFVDLCIR